MKIGVFDSGIGGLTVLQSLIKKYPNHSYIYYGDSKNLPYGDKSVEQLTQFSEDIIRFFEEKKVDLIVVACGTMSSILDKGKYATPIVDVITTTVSYLAKRGEMTYGLIATPRTIQKGIFKEKMEKVGKTVFDYACPNFVYYIENLKYDDPALMEDCALYLKELKQKKVTHVILGCTHYGMLKKQIKQYFDYDIEFITLGEALVSELVLKDDISSKDEVTIYFTLITDNMKQNIAQILGENHKEITTP